MDEKVEMKGSVTVVDVGTFRPFERTFVWEIGEVLSIQAIDATIPERLLPARVRLSSVYKWRLGYQWYAHHDGGVIHLPDVSGDGEPSLRQLVGWLERHGYRDATPGLGDPPIYERTVV